MTTINLFANDQHLTAVFKPKIASGDMNSVLLHVEFDPIWDRFTKSAVFFTSSDETVYEMILTDGECTVPHEVLAESGTLFIGVRGVSAENSAIKTSTLVKYKVDAGAPVGDGTTVDPTPDVYQQIMERLNTLETGGSSGTGNNAEVFNGGEPEQASGDHSHAEGYRTKASGDRSHAEGEFTEAGWRSHAEGFLTLANSTSHSEGRVTEATGKGAHAEGLETYEDVLYGSSKVVTLEATSIDAESFTVGMQYDSNILAIGGYVVLCPTSSTTGFSQTDVRRIVDIRAKNGADPTVTYFINEPFRGTNYFEGNNAPSDGIIPAGAQLKKAIPVIASGEGAHAEGVGAKASGVGAHAEGKQTEAKGAQAHAEGLKSKAYSTAGHAEGFQTQAGVTPGNAEVTGDTSCAHAEGNNTKAYAFASHAEGQGTIAASSAQHAQGKYNVKDKANKYAHIVGNGTSDTNRKNIHTLGWSGNGWFAGDVYVGGSGQDDPNAEKLVKLSDLKPKLVETIKKLTSSSHKCSVGFELGKRYRIDFLYGNIQYSVELYTNPTKSAKSGTFYALFSSSTNVICNFNISYTSPDVLSLQAISFDGTVLQSTIYGGFADINIYELPY